MFRSEASHVPKAYILGTRICADLSLRPKGEELKKKLLLPRSSPRAPAPSRDNRRVLFRSGQSCPKSVYFGDKNLCRPQLTANRRRTEENPPARLLLPGGLRT